MSDISSIARLLQMQREIRDLTRKRRQVVLQILIVPLLGVGFAIGMRDAELVTADLRGLAGLVFLLLTWAAVRAIADTAGTLEEDCPACAQPFFGGLRRAYTALPLPPTACVNCGLRLDAADVVSHRDPGSSPT